MSQIIECIAIGSVIHPQLMVQPQQNKAQMNCMYIYGACSRSVMAHSDSNTGSDAVLIPWWLSQIQTFVPMLP